MPTDFKPGDAIAVTDGTLKGYCGTVDRAEESNVFVRMVIFGRITDLISIQKEWVRSRTAEDRDPSPP